MAVVILRKESHMMQVKVIIAAIFVFSLSGCGTAGSVAIAIPSSSEQSFTFRDDRPAEQRVSRNNISESGETFFFADDNLSPPPAEMLRRTFMNRASQVLKGHTVTLTEFNVTVTTPTVSLDRNSFDAASHSVASAPPGSAVLAAPVILGIESIRSYKTVAVEIRGRIDGTELFVYRSDEFQGRVTEDDIRGVILAALERAVMQVQRIVHE